MKRITTFFTLLVFVISAQAQILVNSYARTPQTSAFGDVGAWLRADNFTGTNPNIVLIDKSANGRNFTQVAGTLTPGTAANGQARITGNGTARLTSSWAIESWPVTIITVGRRAAGATVGFFGHQGASPFNSLWVGYESTNRFFIYNTNATNNTTAEGGTDACWVARIGYGSRVPILNGLLLADMTNAGQLRTAAVATTIGTEYRGLAMDWQECLIWNRVLSLSELDEVYTYINTRYGMSIPLYSSLTAVDGVWMGGQSNTAGRGDRGVADANIPAEYTGNLTGVNIWASSGVNDFTGTSWETLNIANNKHMLGDPQAATYIGHEVTFGKEYKDITGRDIYIMKYALGSTSLAFQTSTTGHWSFTNNTVTPASTFRMYGLNMRNWWLSLRAHQVAGRRPTLKALLWFQGENDATNQPNADAYADNLVGFFAELRRELGIPSPILKIMRIHINGSETYESTVRAQQAIAAAAIPGAEMINTDIFQSRAGDGVHLGVTGQLDLGVALATNITAEGQPVTIEQPDMPIEDVVFITVISIQLLLLFLMIYQMAKKRAFFSWEPYAKN